MKLLISDISVVVSTILGLYCGIRLGQTKKRTWAWRCAALVLANALIQLWTFWGKL